MERQLQCNKAMMQLSELGLEQESLTFLLTWSHFFIPSPLFF